MKNNSIKNTQKDMVMKAGRDIHNSITNNQVDNSWLCVV